MRGEFSAGQGGKNDEPAPEGEDWVEVGGQHATTGDPAYDLAIVTRGVRRPFQIADGLERLLEEYVTLSGRTIDRAHVRIHELALAGRRYRAALDRTRREGPSPRGGVGGLPEGESAEEALGLMNPRPAASAARSSSLATSLGRSGIVAPGGAPGGGGCAFTKLKESEWCEHHAQISAWERQTTLDC